MTRRILARAALLSVAPIAVLYLVLLVIVSDLASEVPPARSTAALMVMSFGGTLRVVRGSASGGPSAVLFAMALSGPLIVAIGQHALHRRSVVSESEAVGYSMSAAGATAVATFVLALCARSSAQIYVGGTDLQGVTSVSVIIPLVFAPAVAGLVAWRAVTRRGEDGVGGSIAPIGRVWLGLAWVGVIAIAASVFWVGFFDALGKLIDSTDWSISDLLGSAAGSLLALPNAVTLIVLALAGAKITTSTNLHAGVEFLGSSTYSGVNSQSVYVPWWAQLAFLVVVIIAATLIRRRSSSSQWWQSAIVYATLGLVLAWATQFRFRGELDASVLGADIGSRFGIEAGTALLRMGIIGTVIGVLAHPAVMARTDAIVGPIRDTASGIGVPIRRAWNGLVPRRVANLPSGIWQMINMTTVIAIACILAIVLGNVIRVAGNAVTPNSGARASELARVLRTGEGARAADLLQIQEVPVSSPGIAVSVRELPPSVAMARPYEFLYATESARESTFVVVRKTFDDGPLFGLIARWEVVGSSSIPRLTVSGSGDVVVDEQPIPRSVSGAQSQALVMPGTHRVRVSGVSPFIDGIDRNYDILASQQLRPQFTVTPEGQRAAVDTVNAYLNACGTACPGLLGGIITTLPLTYTVTALGSDTVRVVSQQAGRYSYSVGTRYTYTYSYPFVVNARVTFSASSPPAVQSIDLD